MHSLICVTIRYIIISTLSVVHLSDFAYWLSGAARSYDTEKPYRKARNKLINVGLSTYTMKGTEGTAYQNVVTHLSESASKYAPE